jgi:hypothetical protein
MLGSRRDARYTREQQLGVLGQGTRQVTVFAGRGRTEDGLG